MNNNIVIKNEKNKYIHLEILRIFAAFFVIFNHTGADGYFLFAQKPPGSIAFWIYMLISVFCKLSVPVYLAISGALLLNKPDEPLKKLFLNRILRIFIILLLYSFGFYIYQLLERGGNFSVKEFFVTVYSRDMEFHLWYLYLFIAYLLVVPLLKALVQNLKDKYFYYMFGLAVFFSGLLPVLEYLLSQGGITIEGNIKPAWVFSYIVIYPCAGYFLQNRLKIDSVKKKLGWIWLANMAGLIISCYMTYYKGMVEGVIEESRSQTFFSSFALLNCIAVYLTARVLFEGRKLHGRAEKILLSLGKCTFGIYLLHVVFLKIGMKSLLVNTLTAAGINPMLSILAVTLLILIATYLLVYIISKIPVLKKIVGL